MAMKKRVKKVYKSHVIYEGRFLRFIKKDRWEFIERNNCSAIVIIVAVTKENKVLFVEQYRPPVGKKVIEFPAGLINDECVSKKESILEGARRELLEERGYAAKRIKKLISGPVSGGSSADIVTMLMAFDLEKKGKGGGVPDEGITVHEVLLDKAEGWLKDMEKKGRLVEPKIYSGLYFLHKYNERFVDKNSD